MLMMLAFGGSLAAQGLRASQLMLLMLPFWGLMLMMLAFGGVACGTGAQLLVLLLVVLLLVRFILSLDRQMW